MFMYLVTLVQHSIYLDYNQFFVYVFLFLYDCLCFLENAAKLRIELVKDRGLVTVQSLESRAHETFTNMEKWFQERYLSEMKWYDIRVLIIRCMIHSTVLRTFNIN